MYEHDKEDEDKEKKELQSIVHIVYKKLIKYLISVETKKKKKFLEGNKEEKYLLPEFGKDFFDYMNIT